MITKKHRSLRVSRLAATCWGLLAFSLLPKASVAQTPGSQGPILRGLPHLFAPGVISTPDAEGMPSFSPDGKTVYFCKYNPGWFRNTIVVSHRMGDRWSTPEVASFSGVWADTSPFVSPDGQRLFFSSNRPADGSIQARDNGDLWYVELTAAGSWGEPHHIEGAVNSDADDVYPSVTRDGTLYFMSTRAGAHIYRSRVTADGYGPPELLPFSSHADDHMPTVAADERFLIFFSEDRGGSGRGDLFVTFHNPDDTWSAVINLGPQINSPAYESAPRLSPDNQTLYFSSDRIDAPAVRLHRVNYRQLEQELHAIQNGLTNIYSVDISDLQKLNVTTNETRRPN